MENNENIKRARNFSDFDKNVLFEIVQNYLHIVENKKTDASNVKLKNEAWASIARQFNSTCQSGIRTEKQLHALYDGIKKKARKNMYHDKKETYKTGGGLFTPKSDNLDSKIVQTLGVQFHSLPNPFDSSADYLNEEVMPGSEDRINLGTCQQDCIQVNKSAETIQMDIGIESQMSAVKSMEVNTGEEEQTVKVIAVEVVEPSSMLQTPMKKRKILASAGKLSEKKESYLSTLSKRIVNRKNSKDYNDDKIRNKKL
ncbi:myb/SANT-like DNA-binding domain-containing protein 3 [Anoplophora glabripennis]|uniref:myb/SANT-like DNA-binding domain-containing protein 3 n=1 Tax=Anoplophora glabripennis TaxID=217634 RepID=UPI0008734EF7|nr:myb/SANT-like DNA-binding domain-containing protein 3 [Anoplophora glabripennis]